MTEVSRGITGVTC